MSDERLAGIWEKIRRASDHLDELHREWGDALEKNRAQVFAPLQFEPDTGWYESGIGRLDLPYLRLAAIGGEVAYQLVQRLSTSHKRSCEQMAPNHMTERRFRSNGPLQSGAGEVAGSALRGVSEAAIDLIGRELGSAAGFEGLGGHESGGHLCRNSRWS
jgi:hypothetical protein